MTATDPTARVAPVPRAGRAGPLPAAAQPARHTAAAAGDAPALGRRRWAVLAVLAAALLLVSVGAAVLDLALPSLARDLAPSATELLWIVDAYSLVLAGLLVTMGTLGDRWGRKRLLLLGVALFGGASLLAAFADSAALVILARAVQGVGGAMIMPATLSIVRATFVEPRERTLAVGVWTAVAGAGGAIGPILGGVLLERFWWGSTFLVNVPIMAIVLLLAARLLPESRAPGAGPWDLPSALLSIGGVGGLLYGIKEAAVHGPLDLGVLLIGLPGLLLLVLFVRRQRRLPHPLLDLALFRERRFAAAVGSNALALFGLMGAFFFLSQHVQLVLGYAPLRAALALLPAMVAAVFAALLVGPAARRLGIRAIVAGGLAAMAVGLGGFGLLDAERYVDLGVALLLVGLGAGLAMTAASDAIIAALPPARSGAAAAISETGQELGTVLGVAVLGSVMNAVYARSFGPVPGVAADLLAAARAGLPTAAEVADALGGPAGAALFAAARDAFLRGLGATAAAGAAVLALAALLAWRFLPGRGVPPTAPGVAPKSGSNAAPTPGTAPPPVPAGHPPAPVPELPRRRRGLNRRPFGDTVYRRRSRSSVPAGSRGGNASPARSAGIQARPPGADVTPRGRRERSFR